MGGSLRGAAAAHHSFIRCTFQSHASVCSGAQLSATANTCSQITALRNGKSLAQDM